jgi:hypothetical protein
MSAACVGNSTSYRNSYQELTISRRLLGVVSNNARQEAWLLTSTIGLWQPLWRLHSVPYTVQYRDGCILNLKIVHSGLRSSHLGLTQVNGTGTN